MVNNTDYGLKMHDQHHRMVSLYEPNTGPGHFHHHDGFQVSNGQIVNSGCLAPAW